MTLTWCIKVLTRDRKDPLRLYHERVNGSAWTPSTRPRGWSDEIATAFVYPTTGIVTDGEWTSDPTTLDGYPDASRASENPLEFIFKRAGGFHWRFLYDEFARTADQVERAVGIFVPATIEPPRPAGTTNCHSEALSRSLQRVQPSGGYFPCVTIAIGRALDTNLRRERDLGGAHPTREGEVLERARVKTIDVRWVSTADAPTEALVAAAVTAANTYDTRWSAWVTNPSAANRQLLNDAETDYTAKSRDYTNSMHTAARTWLQANT
ncbi:MAG: hypothetical protein M3619_04560 [Myxococcota bacterium]|nr:hypothetical protein [Myxococcota bacterium]